jgi:hypothetical protein
MSKHAKLSPSGSAGWIACAHWRSDPSSNNEHARTGTAAHTLASWCLTMGKEPADFYGKPIEVEGGDAVYVDIEMIDSVTLYVETVHELAYPENKIFVEQEVDISHLTGEVGATGTADCIILKDDGELIVVDFKNGRMPVEVESNSQLAMYASGAVEKFDMLMDIERIRAVIVQPNAGGIKEEWYPLGELRIDRTEIAEAAKVYGDPNVPRTPGQTQCTWCANKSTCPELAEMATSVVRESFEDLSIAFGDLDLLQDFDDAEHLSRAFMSIELLELWIKSVKARVEKDMTDGRKIPGLKLVLGKRGNRKFADEKAVVEIFKSLGVPVDLIFTTALNTPAAFDKLVKQKLIPKEVVSQASMFIEQTEPKPTVATVSDPRPAVSANVGANLFDNLQEQ